jgi:predicted kinase
MTGKVTIIVGLPGSGKSHLIRKLRKRATGECVEDFMAFSYDDSRRFTDSKHYPKLIRDLRKGRHSIIADIFFCDTALRDEAERVIQRDSPKSEIEWIYFENDPKTCRKNAVRRNRVIVDHDLVMIGRLATKYFFPEGISPIPVWGAKKTDITNGRKKIRPR